MADRLIDHGSADEESWLAELAAEVPTRGSGLELGIGDDGAVFAGGRRVVVLDLTVEGRHFRRDWSAPEQVGHKALARNLSDLAAMGARPQELYLGLRVDPGDRAWAVRLYRGLGRLARDTGAVVAGGDLSLHPGPLQLALTALGRPGARLIRRDNAQPGDRLWLSGAVGAAAAGLALLQRRGPTAAAPPAHILCLDRHRLGCARLELGSQLAAGEHRVAGLDLSDGLVTDALRLARASQVALHLDPDAPFVDPAARRVARELGLDPLSLALFGGDDYELLLAGPAALGAELPADCVCLGEVRAGPPAVWLGDRQLG